MHAAFGKTRSICQAPDALFAVFTNRVENDHTLSPQSHGVGPCFEGWLTLRKSALQSTRSTTNCPGLGGYPEIGKVSYYPRAVYFSLFDKDKSVLNCVAWPGRLKSLGIDLKEGMEVTIQGYPDVYSATGQLKFKADVITPVGGAP